MIEFLFLDLDDTILDFKLAEYKALQASLREFGIEPTDAICSRYSQINQLHWEALERGEMTRPQVMVGRFQMLFAELGAQGDAAACSRRYMENLGEGHDFLPGALEAVERLSKKYKLYAATNGTKTVQTKRIEQAGLRKYFQNIFISQDIGIEKPSLEFFKKCFAQIPGFDPKKAMIVGDSLTSDIQGGINSGMTTCWVNPKHKTSATIHPDHEIECLPQLEALLNAITP